MIEPPDLKLLESAAKDALILALIERVNDLIAENAKLKERLARLEAKLGEPPKTPSNSSLPPSQGRKASGEASSMPNGKPHKGTNRELHPNPTRTLDVRAKECSSCGGDVSGVEQSALERYDRIELPEIKPDVTRVVLHGGTCPCCSARFKAAPPPGFEPGSPFGPNLRAFAIYLRVANAVSFERLSQLMSDLVGLGISEGALVNMFAASQPAFARAAALIRAKLLSGTILQSDETGMRGGKQNWWAFGCFIMTGNAASAFAPSRGKDVVEAFLGEHRPDFWVSDRLAAQMGWAKKDNQVCLAHLIRDANYAVDAGDDAFAPALRKLLKRACAIARRRPGLADATLRAYAQSLNVKLDALLRLTPTHAAGVKLKQAIAGCRRHLFVFLEDRAIPATNNVSEQALRPCVVFRKVTNWPSLPEGGLRAKPGTQLSPFRPRPPIRAESGRGRHSAEREGSPQRRFRVRARDRLRYQCAHRPGDPHRSVPNSRNWRAKRRERRRGSALSASTRAVSRQNGVDDFRCRISPTALMIYEQKQWGPTSPQSARPQYRIYSDEVVVSPQLGNHNGNASALQVSRRSDDDPCSPTCGARMGVGLTADGEREIRAFGDEILVSI